jgi:hypothetical protein
MGKKVKIILGKNGSVRVEAEGFKGGSCEKATAFIDELFEKKKRVYKDSYYEEEDGDKVLDGLPSGWCG